jgi:hypothetical protein
VLDDDLLEDFDVRCAVVIVNSERVVGFKPSAHDVELACEARELLGRYIGLETFMMGVLRSPPPTARLLGRRSPAALLNQDGYTVRALRECFREYLGAPTTDSQVSILRKVSNAVTKYGY